MNLPKSEAHAVWTECNVVNNTNFEDVGRYGFISHLNDKESLEKSDSVRFRAPIRAIRVIRG